jgi:NADH-quinone oxidoreductase subunit L
LFSGFWSKDEILNVTLSSGNTVLLAFAVITVFLTAFYTFRMFFLTFHGRSRGEGHPHEADWWMRGPLVILAIPAAIVGFWGAPPPFGNLGFQHFLEGAAFHEVPANLAMAVVGALLAVVGIVVAWLLYGARAFATEPLARLGGAYTLLMNRYYVDELYMWLIDKLAIGVAYALALFDRQGLDGVVNGIARLIARTGSGLRGMQTGRVQNYGLVLFGGVTVIALIFVAARPLLAP